MKKAWKVNYISLQMVSSLPRSKAWAMKRRSLLTYTVDGKMPMVAADKQKLTKSSNVVFTLKKY